MRELAIQVVSLLWLSSACNAPVVGEVVVIAGGNTPSFWSYAVETDVWSELPDVPRPIGPGGAITYLGTQDDLYILCGGRSRDFYRYDPSSGNWSQLAATPGEVAAGGGLAAINYGAEQLLYALQGGGSTSVWEYEVATDEWRTIAEVPEPVAGGGAITAPPGRGPDVFLDVLAGGGSTTVHGLLVGTGFSTVGTAPAPVILGGSISNLHTDGCDLVFTGGGTDFFSAGAYCASAGSLTAALAPVGPGGGLATPPPAAGQDEDSVYATRGGDSTEFWRYSISDNAWVTLAATPGPVGDGGAITQVPANAR